MTKKIILGSILMTFLTFSSNSIHAAAIVAKHHPATGQQWQDLTDAIKQGNLSVVSALIPSKIQPWDRTKSGKTIFEYALLHAPQGGGIIKHLRTHMNEKKFYAGLGAQERSRIQGLVQARNTTKKAASNSSIGSAQSSAAQSNEIIFYDANKSYYEFTNFYDKASFDLDLKKWPTSEHYFQAQKFIDSPKIMEEILKVKSARDALNIATHNKNLTRKGWHDANPNDPGWNLKDTIMYQGLRAKFAQHPNLKALLLSTGNAALVEGADIDSYWGWGGLDSQGNRTGQNKLGRLLMRLRTELRSGAQPASAAQVGKNAAAANIKTHSSSSALAKATGHTSSAGVASSSSSAAVVARSSASGKSATAHAKQKTDAKKTLAQWTRYHQEIADQFNDAASFDLTRVNKVITLINNFIAHDGDANTKSPGGKTLKQIATEFDAKSDHFQGIKPSIEFPSEWQTIIELLP